MRSVTNLRALEDHSRPLESRKVPSLAALEKLAKALRVKVGRLLE